MKNNLITPLSKLTIVIPTYNRTDYVLRNMGLLSGTGVEVHVLDGSTEAIKSDKLDRFAPNIHYHHLPISFWQRLAKAADYVDTEYVVLLGDDDFFILSALAACIIQLDNKQELVACYGVGINKCLTSDLIVSCSTISGNQTNYVSASCGEVTQESPLKRMVHHMNPYNPNIIYSVCRSQAWLKTTQLFNSRQYSSQLTAELQFELCMSFHGKVKVIDKLMILRSAENPSCVEGFDLEFDDWYLSQQYRDEVDDFLNISAHDLADISNLEFEVIRQGLELACSAYIKFCDNNNKRSCQSFQEKIFSDSDLLRDLKTRIKKFISIFPSSLLSMLPERLCFRPYVDIAKKLELLGLHVDWDQLNVILKEVKKSNDRI